MTNVRKTRALSGASALAVILLTLARCGSAPSETEQNPPRFATETGAARPSNIMLIAANEEADRDGAVVVTVNGTEAGTFPQSSERLNSGIERRVWRVDLTAGGLPAESLVGKQTLSVRFEGENEPSSETPVFLDVAAPEGMYQVLTNEDGSRTLRVNGFDADTVDAELMFYFNQVQQSISVPVTQKSDPGMGAIFYEFDYSLLGLPESKPGDDSFISFIVTDRAGNRTEQSVTLQEFGQADAAVATVFGGEIDLGSQVANQMYADKLVAEEGGRVRAVASAAGQGAEATEAGSESAADDSQAGLSEDGAASSEEPASATADGFGGMPRKAAQKTDAESARQKYASVDLTSEDDTEVFVSRKGQVTSKNQAAPSETGAASGAAAPAQGATASTGSEEADNSRSGETNVSQAPQPARGKAVSLSGKTQDGYAKLLWSVELPNALPNVTVYKNGDPIGTVFGAQYTDKKLDGKAQYYIVVNTANGDAYLSNKITVGQEMAPVAGSGETASAKSAEGNANAARSSRKTAESRSYTAVPDQPQTPEMVDIPAGELESLYGFEDVAAFAIGKYEVTNEEFCIFLNANPAHRQYIRVGSQSGNVRCRIAKQGATYAVEKGYERHPVIFVSFEGAEAYAQWLSNTLGARFYIPSEAEWEYAARSGPAGDSFMHSGSNDAKGIAWTKANSGSKLHVVGSKKANGLGIHDMTGNAAEWVYPRDKKGHAIKGGSWNDKPVEVGISVRRRIAPKAEAQQFSAENGFRVARK